MRQVDKRDFLRLAREAGYKKVRCRGDHMILKNAEGKTISFTIRNPKSVVLLRLIKQFELEKVA